MDITKDYFKLYNCVQIICTRREYLKSYICVQINDYKQIKISNLL